MKNVILLLIPSRNTTVEPNTVVEDLLDNIGRLNIEMSDETCAFKFKYYPNEEQREAILKLCEKHDYSCLFLEGGDKSKTTETTIYIP